MNVFCETELLVKNVLWAISFGTTNTNTQNDTNFCIFFKFFENFSPFLIFFSLSMAKESPLKFDNTELFSIFY